MWPESGSVQRNAPADGVEHFSGARGGEPFDDDGLVILSHRELHVLPRRSMEVFHIRQGDGTQAVTARRQCGVLQHAQADGECSVALSFQGAQPTEVLRKPQGSAERDAGSFAHFRQGELRFCVGEGVEQAKRAVEQGFARSGSAAAPPCYRHGSMLPFIESRGNGRGGFARRSVGRKKTVASTGVSQMSNDALPVLIIGGGPVGLALAEELTFHGVPVTVVEPRVIVDHSRPRAKTTSVRTMEYFRRWGIADRLRAAAPLGGDWSQRVTFVQTLTRQRDHSHRRYPRARRRAGAVARARTAGDPAPCRGGAARRFGPRNRESKCCSAGMRSR